MAKGPGGTHRLCLRCSGVRPASLRGLPGPVFFFGRSSSMSRGLSPPMSSCSAGPLAVTMAVIWSRSSAAASSVGSTRRGERLGCCGTCIAPSATARAAVAAESVDVPPPIRSPIRPSSPRLSSASWELELRFMASKPGLAGHATGPLPWDYMRPAPPAVRTDSSLRLQVLQAPALDSVRQLLQTPAACDLFRAGSTRRGAWVTAQTARAWRRQRRRYVSHRQEVTKGQDRPCMGMALMDRLGTDHDVQITASSFIYTNYGFIIPSLFRSDFSTCQIAEQAAAPTAPSQRAP